MILLEKNYIDKAENVIGELCKRKGKNGKPEALVTTSKIRNLLAMTADIYNEVQGAEDILPDSIVSRIGYLRIKFIYECRERAVKNLIDEAQILDALKEIGNSRQRYILFSRYMEALVAFRKICGKKMNDFLAGGIIYVFKNSDYRDY